MNRAPLAPRARPAHKAHRENRARPAPQVHGANRGHPVQLELRARLVRRVRLVHRVQKERQAFKALLVLMEKLQQSRLVP